MCQGLRLWKTCSLENIFCGKEYARFAPNKSENFSHGFSFRSTYATITISFRHGVSTSTSTMGEDDIERPRSTTIAGAAPGLTIDVPRWGVQNRSCDTGLALPVHSTTGSRYEWSSKGMKSSDIGCRRHGVRQRHARSASPTSLILSDHLWGSCVPYDQSRTLCQFPGTLAWESASRALNKDFCWW